MKTLALVFVFFSFSLTMLHSIIPHHHHDDFNYSEHQLEHESAETVIDFLALIFHFEGGDEILDSILKSESSPAPLLLAILSVALIGCIWKLFWVPTKQKHHRRFNCGHYLFHLTHSLGLRGPPSLA